MPPIVEREAQVLLLDRAVGRLLLGVGGAFVVRGAQGSGKTRLLHAAAETARATELPVWWCESGSSPRTDPLRALRRAIGDAAGGAPASRFEILNRIEAEVQRAPHLLVVDDLESIDVATRSVLAELAEHIHEIPLLLLFSLRTDQHVELPPTLGRATVVRTPRLSTAGTAQFVQGALGAAPGPGLLRSVDGCRGNPAHLWIWLHHLEACHLLGRAGDRVELVGDPGPAPPLRALTPDALAGLYGRDALLLLEVASVLGRRFQLDDLAAVMDLPENEIRARLAGPVAGGGLSIDGRTVRTHWPGMLRLLYETLEPAERTRIHHAYARRLDAAGAPPTLVAEHFLAGAERGDPVAAEAGRRGAHAVRLEVPETAVELLQQTLAILEPGDPARHAVLADLAEAEVMAGEATAAALHARQGLDGDPPPAELRRLATTLLDAQMLAARGEDTVAETTRVLDDPRVTTDEDRRALWARRAWGHLWLQQPVEAEADARRALVDGREEAVDHASSIALAALAHLAALSGEPARALALLADWRPEEGAGDWLAVPNTFSIIRRADALTALDRYDEALAVLRHGLEVLDRLGRNTLGASSFLGAVAYASYCAGAWDDAIAECEAAISAARVVGTEDATSEASVLRAVIGFYRGGGPGPRRIASRIEELGEGRGGLRPDQWALLAAARSRQRDVAGAAAAIRQAWAAAEERGDARQLPFLLPHVLQALHSAGASDAEVRTVIRPMAGRLLSLAQRWDAPSVLAASTLARGVRDGNAAALVQAAQRYRSSPRVPDRAIGLEACGIELLRAGQRDLGLDAMFSALDVYRALGAGGPASRMSAHLRQLGVRRGTRSPRLRPEFGWESLGVTELRIAALVSSGLSNPQIAERTGLSRHIVAAHVDQLMSKLGVASRLELGLLVARRARDEEMLQKREPAAARRERAAE